MQAISNKLSGLQKQEGFPIINKQRQNKKEIKILAGILSE